MGRGLFAVYSEINEGAGAVPVSSNGGKIVRITKHGDTRIVMLYTPKDVDYSHYQIWDPIQHHVEKETSR